MSDNILAELYKRLKLAQFLCDYDQEQFLRAQIEQLRTEANLHVPKAEPTPARA